MLTDARGAPVAADDRWWRAETNDLAEAVFAAAYRVDDATLARQQRVLEAYCLYGDTSDWPHGGSYQSSPYEMAKNVLAGVVDTFVAELCQSTPRAMFVTVGASWAEQYKARRLTSCSDAWADDERIREVGPLVLRDSAIGGLGIARIWPDHHRARARLERVFPLHLLVDDVSCIDVAPRAIYQRRVVERDYLAQCYPDAADAIERADAPREAYTWAFARRASSVEVIEAWHLPSTPDADDGRHVMAVRSGVLLDEPWEREQYPFAFLRAVPPSRGFWGESLLMRAAPEQLELNKLALRIQDAMHLMSVPRIFVAPGSINKAHMNTDIGVIVETTSPPVSVTMPAMNGEVYQREQTLEAGIYKRFGISALSAASEKPAGLSSGKALRTYREMQSRRFIVALRAYERWHCDVAREWVAAMRALAEETPGIEALYDQQGAVERLAWRSIDIDADRLRLRVMSASALPTEPAARIEMLQEMLSEGTISIEQFYSLADVPDFEAIRDEMIAPTELLRQRFDRMLETGEYTAPEPYEDLAAGVRLAVRMVQRAELRNAPEDRCELLRRWMLAAQHWLSQATIAIGPGPSPAGPAPPTPGTPPMPQG
jgi:hypothetical protein